MKINMNLDTIYNWITSLLRTRAYQCEEFELPADAGAANNPKAQHGPKTFVINNELIPTLNFVVNRRETNCEEYQYSAAADNLSYADGNRTPDAEDPFNVEEDEDSISTHTYIISINTDTTTPAEQDSISTEAALTSTGTVTTTTTSTTETSELLRKQVNLCLSLTDEQTLPFYSIDDPTSSITIEMAENHTTATTATTTASSDGALPPAVTTSLSANVTASSSAVCSGSSSFEEDIDEVIEVSEELDMLSPAEQIGSISEVKFSTEIKQMTGPQVDNSQDMPELTEAAASQSLVESAENYSGAGVEKFQIGDEELFGGQLTRHFVLAEENDDDGTDDTEKEKPEEMKEVQTTSSKHIQVKGELGSAKDKESLNDQSTTDDVSDFADESRNTESEGGNIELMGQIHSYTQSEDKMEAGESPTRTGANVSESIEAEAVMTSMTTIKAGAEAEAPLLFGGLPEKSEPDDSLKDIVVSNPPVEINLDAQNEELLSSLFGKTDIAVQEPQAKQYAEVLLDNDCISPSQTIKKITGLDTADNPPEVQPVETIERQTYQEAKIVEHKRLKALETIQLKPAEIESGLELNLEQMDVSTDLQNQTLNELTHGNEANEQSDGEDDSIKLMKIQIMAMQKQTTRDESRLSPTACATTALTPNVTSNDVKQMERMQLTEFCKDMLEDITEESERGISIVSAEEQPSLSLELESDSKAVHQPMNYLAQEFKSTVGESSSSIVSLNMFQQLEQKLSELESQLQSKDVCLASLTMQLEQSQRRGSTGAMSNTEQPVSARDMSSLVTNSTEYRTFQDEFSAPTLDIYVELTKRDVLIAKLTDSLQQSLTTREQLQSELDKLNTEMLTVRRQLMDAIDKLKRPSWPRISDQESSGGQRISQISMDLISESEDDLEQQFIDDNEEKYMRSARERQLSMSRQLFDNSDVPPEGVAPFSNQIEQFQKYLTPHEMRLFFMVQKKFDDFLNQELEKCRIRNEQEFKIALDQWNTEKEERIQKIEQLLQAKRAQDVQHAKEMESLRKYFELKCADLEKQFSDDVFSQKSQRHGEDSSSECSEADLVSEEVVSVDLTVAQGKESSPRKRFRAQLLLSPSHRQITPCGIDSQDELCKTVNENMALEIADIKIFYQTKIHELKRSHEAEVRKINERLKYYECRYSDDDFGRETKEMGTGLPNNDSSDTKSTTCNAPLETANTKQVNSMGGDSANDEDENGIGQNTSIIIIDQDELNFNNESQVIKRIIEEYDRRLQEQLALARKDIVDELEQQIQNLLSDSTVNDQHWPKELILLREKFTAKSQLEITQLNIKHEHEMSRLKLQYEMQLNRKFKRQSAFDSTRDLKHVISECDGLRELSKIFRNVLTQLAHCVANCEEELNATLTEEVQRHLLINRSHDGKDLDHTLGTSFLNVSLNTTNKQLRFVPDVQSLLEVVEDQSLVHFIDSKSSEDVNNQFDLNECLEKLKSEAAYLLQLSEDLRKHHEKEDVSFFNEVGDGFDTALIKTVAEKKSVGANHDNELEDGLNLPQRAHKFLRTLSLNEQQLTNQDSNKSRPTNSLPPDLNRLESPASELNFQLIELKNRLIKSETDRHKLQQKLENTISRNTELGTELQVLRDQLSELHSLNQTDYAEGYGLGANKSAQASSTEHSSVTFVQLQEKARNMLSSPTQKCQNNDPTVLLLQMIEDFCREGDKVVECGKRDREDLQSQIDNADKQLRATRQFLEEQAVEREQECDEFVRELERLQTQLRDKEKECNSYANASEEYTQLEGQMREVTQKLSDTVAKRDKFEVELKASIDKIFVLREIISDLETQIEMKAINEHALGEKVRQLEEYVGSQNQSNHTLQQEVQSLKTEIGESYQTRIFLLEEKLENVRPSAEQGMVLDRVVEQLSDVEHKLEQKTKTLESIHHMNSSNSCSLSATEDISVHGNIRPASQPPVVSVSPPEGTSVHPSPRQHSITMESVQRIVEKLDKHSRVEEAAVKRVQDLDMQLTQARGICVELQNERDSLQGRIDEQTERIATLQTRLEEQRHHAEELQRAGTSELNIRVHDLQTEVQTLNEKLSASDKQIKTLKQQLERSKKEINQLEAQLTLEQADSSILQRLEAEIKHKNNDLQNLKDKIKSDKINRIASPDLIEAVLVDKNDEIDHLRAQLDAKEKELRIALDSSRFSPLGVGVYVASKQDASTKLSAHTLSDIVSITEFDELEAVRRVALNDANTPVLVLEEGGGFLQQTIESSKDATANVTRKRTEDLSGFMQLLQPTNTYFQDPHFLQTTHQLDGTFTPGLVPRQINFSTLEYSKVKSPEDLLQPILGQEALTKLIQGVNSLKQKLSAAEQNKVLLNKAHTDDIQTIEEELVALQLRLGGLQDDLQKQQTKLEDLQKANENVKQLESALAAKCTAYEALNEKQIVLNSTCTVYKEQLTKQEKNLSNYAEHEEKYLARIEVLEKKVLEVTEREVGEREKLRKELRSLSEVHELCKHAKRDAQQYKLEVEQLNTNIRAKEQNILKLNKKLEQAEERLVELPRQVEALEREVERLKQQQSDNSSKQFSVDEIALQVEKELNYSAHLDSNILKAIESEEENNFDTKQQRKMMTQAKPEAGTSYDNVVGERELLNQIEALRTQLNVEREQCDSLKLDLQSEKQHSQEIQEQDVLIIEAMRKRLETALDKEDNLHKQLDQEREHCEHLQTQLTSLQRAESRKNSSLLLKSPMESPRKSPRSSVNFESESGERLRSEIKLLAAQNERERERSADIQRSGEREKQRFAVELQERVEYCERLKCEMEKLMREKDSAKQVLDHLQERFTLQSTEIESLEARLLTLQEAETRRLNRRERQIQENAQLLAELQDFKTKFFTAECERDVLNKLIVKLRFDVERSAQREAKLADGLALANDRLSHSIDDNVPQQFLQKMKEINDLLATNTQENHQMAESMHFLASERRALQKKVEELETQLSNSQNSAELEERCRHLLGRYLRVESHRKALVYQKRYLKMSLESYQDNEQRAIAAIRGTYIVQQSKRDKTKLFKTVALAVVAIQRIKYIGRIWSTGKRIVSKSVFTITQQKRSSPITSCPTLGNPGNYQPMSLTLPTVNLSTIKSVHLPPDVTIKSPSKTTLTLMGADWPK